MPDQELTDGDNYCLPYDNFAIEMITDCDDLGVRGELVGPINEVRVESNAPYFLFGNTLAGEVGGRAVTAGSYTFETRTLGGNNVIVVQFTFSCQRRLGLTSALSFRRSVLVSYMTRSSFAGASGVVSFAETDHTERNPEHIAVGAFVISSDNKGLNSTSSYKPILTSVYEKFAGGWEDRIGQGVGTFFDRFSGTGRQASDDNYLRRTIRWIALVLMIVVWVASVFTMMLLLVYRKKSHIKDSQPLYLCLLCVGAIVSSMSIATLAWDEGAGYSQEQLSFLCMATPWLFFLGQAIGSASLVTMLWRMEVARARGDVTSAVEKNPRPLLGYFIVSAILLGVWSAVDPWSWQRIDIQSIPLETFGQCHCPSQLVFSSIFVGSLLLSSVMSFRYAWMTIHNPAAGSILYGSYSQAQCWCFGIPMLSVIGRTSVEGVFFARVLVIWILSISNVISVAGPVTIRALLLAKASDARRPRVIMVSLNDRSEFAENEDFGSQSVHIRS